MAKKSKKYVLIINGYVQESIYPFDSFSQAIACIKELADDGRLKETDDVQVKKTEETTFTIDMDEIQEIIID